MSEETDEARELLLEKIEELKAELEKRGVSLLSIKLGNKRNVVVGGPGLRQRFPVTLYAPGWVELLKDENVQAIKQFMEDNKDKLSWEK